MVDSKSPPITAIAMGARNSPPSPVASAEGIIPALMAMVVMTMGRARLWTASRIASRLTTPRSIADSANSTSMMEFLVTIPISIRKPMTTAMLIELPVMNSARIAPPMASGRDIRIVTGVMKLWNSSTSTT